MIPACAQTTPAPWVIDSAQTWRAAALKVDQLEITDDGVFNHNHGLRHRLIRLAHRARDSVSGIPGFGNGNGNGNSGGAFGGDDTTMGTDSTEFEDRKSRWDDRRRDTHFSVERDGDDARPAILYRSMHNIA